MRYLRRIATRIDTLNEVERAFNASGIYPPNMREVSPDVYGGEIDAGWVLTVTDELREMWLNGWPLRSLKQVIDAYVSKDPKFQKGALPPVPSPVRRRPDIDQALYGRTKPFAYVFGPDYQDDPNSPSRYSDSNGNPVDEADMAGSNLFWSAFEELDIVDWHPLIDEEAVIEKTREIAKRTQSADPDSEAADARGNWETYRERYMEGHIDKLRDKGIITPGEAKDARDRLGGSNP